MITIIIAVGVWHLLMNLSSLISALKADSYLNNTEDSMYVIGKSLYEKVVKFWMLLVTIAFSGLWYFGSYRLILEAYPLLGVLALVASALSFISDTVMYKELRVFEDAVVYYRNLGYDKRYKTGSFYRSTTIKVVSLLLDLALLWALVKIS